MTIGGQKSGRRRRPTVEDRVYHWLSDEWGGNDVPPGSQAKHIIETYPDGDYMVATANEDGGSFWIGTGDRWHTHMSRSQARRMGWFIIWNWWIRGEWFGLKRRAWFFMLRRRLNRWRATS